MLSLRFYINGSQSQLVLKVYSLVLIIIKLIHMMCFFHKMIWPSLLMLEKHILLSLFLKEILLVWRYTRVSTPVLAYKRKKEKIVVPSISMFTTEKISVKSVLGRKYISIFNRHYEFSIWTIAIKSCFLLASAW